MDSVHNYHTKTQLVKITEITILKENKWKSRLEHSDCAANKSNRGTLQTFFLWRTADSVFIISSSHTSLCGGGAETCRSVPVNIRGQHLDAWTCYLPRCRGGGD